MYFTIHGKILNSMLQQCVEQKKESEIWKPAKYDGGTCRDEKMRME